VAQMNRAMSKVDEVTQRNAASAEELSATAAEMAGQVDAVRQLVLFFQVPERWGGGLPKAEKPAPAGPTQAAAPQRALRPAVTPRPARRLPQPAQIKMTSDTLTRITRVDSPSPTDHAPASGDEGYERFRR
jgi:hypothetical protein